MCMWFRILYLCCCFTFCFHCYSDSRVLKLILLLRYSYLWVNPNLSSQESRIQPDFCVWFYVQGENARPTQRFSITTQLLVLYYVLSYEEALLANTKILGKCESIRGNRLTEK